MRDEDARGRGPDDDETEKHEQEDANGSDQNEAERIEREEFRDEVDAASNFLGDGPPGWLDDADAEVGIPITVEVATFFGLVPADAPEDWWTDPRVEIGTCPYHHRPPGLSVEENPCPYQACSVVVGRNAKQLYQAAWSELLSASPDLPRDRLWWELLRHWKVVKVDLSLVRVAWLHNLPALRGGEPQVRMSGRALKGRKSPAWDQLRDAVRGRYAAIAVVWGDPMGLNIAARVIIFKAPFQALWRAGAITVGTVSPGEKPIRRLPSLRLGNRLLLAKLLTWPPGRNRLRDRLHFELTMWRANRRQVKKERRERRRVRRTARKEIIRRELALDEPDAETRARTRRALIATVREAIGLIGDLRGNLRGRCRSWLMVPPGVALLLVLHHFVM